MPTRENASGKKVVKALVPASYTTTQKCPTTGIDTKGFESVTFEIAVGSVADVAASPQGDGSWTFAIQESDTTTDGDFAAITDSARIITGGSKSPVTTPNSSTGVFLTIDAPAELSEVYHVGVISSKRYLRVLATAASTPGASLLAISAILENAALTPVSN